MNLWVRYMHDQRSRRFCWTHSNLALRGSHTTPTANIYAWLFGVGSSTRPADWFCMNCYACQWGLFSALYYQQKVWYFMEMDVGRKRNGMRILLVTPRNYGGWLKVQR